MQFNFVVMFHSMGPIAKAVVFVLVFFSVYSVAIGVERGMVFSKAKKQSRILLKLISSLWAEGKVEDSVKLASDKRFKNSHLAKVLVAGLNELQFQEDSKSGPEERLDSAKRAIERATIQGVQEFKRGLNGLATIGSTGPFVGLFGTVFGIINAFQSMSVSGSGGIGAVASGISEALITTGFGIIVAVIAVWFFNYLLNRVDVFTGEMANASSELLDHYIKLKRR
jgi:biopolymer transport protein ExbB